ncbi:MAG: LPS export ABC transporter ATP-binding protein, partial [Planctomycetota bacterium]
MPLLEVRGIRKVYGKRAVVDNVDFYVEPGEIVGLLGPNGAGKTTSFRITIGMIASNGGAVYFNGENVTHMPMYQRARRGMGYLAQEPSVFRRLTVEENLLAILETMKLPRQQRVNRARGLLAELELSRKAHQRADTLSGGERRRLEITRSLVTNPSLLLLDEPFSGIDPKAVAEIQGIVEGLRERGIGILLTDHNVRDTLA